MQLQAIKKLLESLSLDELKALENKLLEGDSIDPSQVPGVDEGEQLTHLSGAIWCLEQSAAQGTTPHEQVRHFAARVRNSIS
ncbi:MAG: hypothetical protein HYZ16_02805 [Bacteroidetes bacterium]|jgi:hypothetical protein|nr:hypothetical protein [Bacteroidota bacterium]